MAGASLVRCSNASESPSPTAAAALAPTTAAAPAPAPSATATSVPGGAKGKTLSGFRYVNNAPDFTLPPKSGGTADIAFRFAASTVSCRKCASGRERWARP